MKNQLLLCLASSVALFSGCSTHRFHPDERRSADGVPSPVVGAERSVSYKVIREQSYAVRDDGVSMQGDLYVPDGKGPFPAVIVVHGGGWARRTREDTEFVAKQFAEHGIVAFNITYRLAPKHVYPAALIDCRDALRWLHTRQEEFNLDAKRIGAYGYSSGAHLVSLLGFMDAKKVPGFQTGDVRPNAIIAGGTPTDLTRFQNSPLVKDFLGATYEQNPRLYEEASPVFHVSSDDPPIFLYHGKWDWVVSYSQMEILRDALVREKVRSETYSVGGIGHYAMFLFGSGAIEESVKFLKSQR